MGRQNRTGRQPVWPIMLLATAIYYAVIFILVIFVYDIIVRFIYNTVGEFGMVLFRRYRLYAVLLLYAAFMIAVYGYAKRWQERRYRVSTMQTLLEQLDRVFADDDSRVELEGELKEVEQKLNELKLENIASRQAASLAEQRKNDLVVYLAHDIRTPLTSVIGYLNLLEEAPDMPEAQRQKYLGITLEKANRLEQLINEFFDITRFNLQTIVLEKREIDLTHFLSQLADELYPVLSPRGKTARVEAEAGLTVHGDADKLARVFNNILKNAAAYSYDGTEILLRGGRREGRVVVDVYNRGATIPQERLETIFEKFYRLDTARSTESGGAGLGLAIAKEIVDAHGGRIMVKSEDEVTAFRVELPV